MRFIAEICFKSDIIAVRLRKDRIIVVLEYKIYVLNLHDLKLRDFIPTIKNPLGLCCISTEGDQEILACPDKKIEGVVLIKFYTEEKKIKISAHETFLACMTLNKDGSLLATASRKGTLIRIFATKTEELIQELRRGIDRAEIYCLSFHPSSE